MQVEQIKSEDLKREYNVTVSAEEINKVIDEKLVKLAAKIKMPGFRPGKVPMDVVKKKHGQDVLGEVLEQTVDSSTRQAIKEQDIRPAMRPKIEILEFDEGKDLKFKIELEVLPEVPEIDTTQLSIKKLKAEVGDKDIEEALKQISSHSKDFVKVERESKKGDAVKLDFKGFVDGEAFEGGEAQGHQLELGSNSFIAGFEEQLEGLKSGDSKDVNVTFPEEYHAPDLAGKPAKFEVVIHEILEAKEQEVNEEFAKKLGLESLDKLKEELKKQLEGEADMACRTLAKKELFDALENAYKFNIPEEMAKLEFDSIWKQLEEAKKSDPDSSEFKKSDDELKKEYQEMADRRVRLGILLSDIGNKNEITISQEELNQAVLAEARQYPGQEQKVVDYYIKNPEHLEALKGPVLEEKVVDFLLKKVKLEEEATTLEELRKIGNEAA